MTAAGAWGGLVYRGQVTTAWDSSSSSPAEIIYLSPIRPTSCSCYGSGSYGSSYYGYGETTASGSFPGLDATWSARASSGNVIISIYGCYAMYTVSSGTIMGVQSATGSGEYSFSLAGVYVLLVQAAEAQRVSRASSLATRHV
jgi:hypothetical protein